MQPRIGSDQSLNIFYQALTLEYRSTEPCSCYNKAIDEICRRLELHRKRGILSIVALITFINGIITVSYTHLTLPTTSRQRQMCIRDRFCIFVIYYWRYEN